ncbi:MAG: serpin family protein, partial [Thermoplasmata archaeon]
MKFLSIGALVAIAVIIGASFYVVTNFDSEIAQPSNSEGSSNVGSIVDFNDSVNGFAFDIYREMYNDPNNSGNIFISPYSIFT